LFILLLLRVLFFFFFLFFFFSSRRRHTIFDCDWSSDVCSSDLPHPHVFSDRALRPGDPVYFDILHSYMGYRTCYYRSFSVGSARSEERRVGKECRVRGGGGEC